MNDRIAKLPKWAQDHIAQLTRQRDDASEALDAFCSENQEGKIVVERTICDGSTRRVDFRLHSEKVKIEHAGVTLDVNCFRDEAIFLSYGSRGSHSGPVSLVPTTHQQIELRTPENHT